MYDSIIAGSGPAGLNAALYLKRAGKNIIVIEKEYEGSGQIAKSICVENYLGIPSLSGDELGERFRQHVLSTGVQIREEEVTRITKKDFWEIGLSSGETLQAKTVIYATGMLPVMLGVPGESTFEGRGVSFCAYCDGPLYQDKEVAVVGGGDTALDDALYLSGVCRKVYLIHRRDKFRGNSATAELLKEKPNVEFILNASVQEVHGEKKLESILLNDGRNIRISGLFVAIGATPESELIREYTALDENGYVIAGEDGVTVTPGLFVAGDIRTKQLRQVITAVSDGANAAASAIQYLSE